MLPKKIGVLMIESLPDDEKQTGEELYNHTLKYITFKKDFLENEFYKIECKDELKYVLYKAYINAYELYKFYFIHFEVHGFEDGIELKNNEKVLWSEIIPLLRNLNFLYKNNLSIYLSVCKGNNLIKFINPFDRSPFGLIIGGFENIYERDLLIFFENFYNKFFENFSTFDAYKTAKELNLKSEFSIITSQSIIIEFLKIEKENNEKERVLEALDKSFKEIINQSESIKNVYDYLCQETSRLFSNYIINEDYFLMNDIKEYFFQHYVGEYGG